MITRNIVFAFFILTGPLAAISVDECLINSVSSFIQNKDSNHIAEITELQKDIINSLNSKANRNRLAILDQIKTNLSLLPDDLQLAIKDCITNSDSLSQLCSEIYGASNCDQISKFTYGPKCPDGFKRTDNNLCIRSCREDQVIIQDVCYPEGIYYLNESVGFSEEIDCLSKYKFCAHDGEKFIETCGPYEERVAFLCIPICIQEMTEEMYEKLKTDPRICLEETISPGTNIFSF
jgi:hypothetical protein